MNENRNQDYYFKSVEERLWKFLKVKLNQVYPNNFIAKERKYDLNRLGRVDTCSETARLRDGLTRLKLELR